MDDTILDLFYEIINQEDLSLSEMPIIDLYMDQVITLFESKLGGSKRNVEDKLLTKTMINNYVKDKILMPAKNKKYTKEHLIMMSFIYNLKQIISINDIKTLFTETIYKEDVDLIKLYTDFLESKDKDKEHIENLIKEKVASLDSSQSNEMDILMMVLSLVNTANIQKRLAEELIDNYLLKKDEEKK